MNPTQTSSISTFGYIARYFAIIFATACMHLYQVTQGQQPWFPTLTFGFAFLTLFIPNMSAVFAFCLGAVILDRTGQIIPSTITMISVLVIAWFWQSRLTGYKLMCSSLLLAVTLITSFIFGNITYVSAIGCLMVLSFFALMGLWYGSVLVPFQNLKVTV